MEENETISKAMAEIAALKSFLEATDYQAIKHADGALSDEEYADTQVKRQQWRDKINEYEAQIAKATATDADENAVG